jgi:glucosamine-6-phosphate deaminase
VELRAVDDPAALAQAAADLVLEAIRARPDAVLLAATGSTPMGCYAELASRSFDSSRMRVAQLDEYVGVPESDARSLYAWMRRSLCEPLRIGDERIIRLRTDGDASVACRTYDAAVSAAGGIDLAILGLGPNGHLGFNEPPTDADAATREVTLTEASLASNGGYWPDAPVPDRARTAGMKLILGARRVLLLVSGAHKADILRRVMDAQPNRSLPASWLHLHPDALVIADRAAVAGRAHL